MENKFGNINISKEFNVEKDPRIYEAIRLVENMLKSRPDFVSVTPVGSKYRGYATESSDIDLLVLFDSSEKTFSLGGKVKNDWVYIGEEKVIPYHLKVKDLTIEIHALNINLENIKASFQERKDGLCRVFLARYAQAIFSPSSNKKITLYRKRFKELFNHYILGNRSKKYFIQGLAEKIAKIETLSSVFKMLERIPNFDDKKRLNQVKDFWIKRLSYFLLKD